MKILLIIFASVLGTLGLPLKPFAIFTCDEFGSHCLLDNVVNTREEPNFEIIATDPSLIKSVQFRNSKLQVLTPAICKAFPNLELLDLQDLGIEVVEVDAFVECTNLLSLALNDNKIELMPVLSTSSKLRYLYLENNRLRQIFDFQFASNPELLFLYLTNNNIDTFPPSAVQGLSRLLGLSLATNDLSDLVVSELLNNLPDLNYIEFNQNELACARVEEILEKFNTKKIKIFMEAEKRERYYKSREVDGITCLEDTVWTGVYYRKFNQNEKIETRAEELGAELEKLHDILEQIKDEIQ